MAAAAAAASLLYCYYILVLVLGGETAGSRYVYMYRYYIYFYLQQPTTLLYIRVYIIPILVSGVSVSDAFAPRRVAQYIPATGTYI